MANKIEPITPDVSKISGVDYSRNSTCRYDCFSFYAYKKRNSFYLSAELFIDDKSVALRNKRLKKDSFEEIARVAAMADFSKEINTDSTEIALDCDTYSLNVLCDGIGVDLYVSNEESKELHNVFLTLVKKAKSNILGSV